MISTLRFVGLPALLWAASHGHRGIFLLVVALLLFSDWLDGILATALHQRTSFGARLDSIADALLYASIALSFWWMENELIRGHMAWMWGVFSSWVLSMGIALARFGKVPSYHLWSAKIAWIVTAGTVFLLLDGITLFLPVALGLVIVANLHATAVTLALPRWEADVWSLRRAWRMRRSGR